ncbi:hypothetical protein [Acinetobacter sp. D009]|uniref:hypothetical protein n=1 Tax=Acinetobacter sp. D009 TaxID=3138069 RepID=UPI003144F133
MSNLRMSVSVAPTLTGVIFATALGSFSMTSHASQMPLSPPELTLKTENLGFSFTSQTFSSVDVKALESSQNLDHMMVNLFEKIAKDAKPLEEDFAKLLSENFIDLF